MRRDPISTEPLGEPDPGANALFGAVLLVVLGGLATLTGLGRLARWEMEDCAALVGTEAACSPGPGGLPLVLGIPTLVLGIVALAVLVVRSRRRG